MILAESSESSLYLHQKTIRRVGKHHFSWPEVAEKVLKDISFRNWRRKAQDREQWRAIVEEANDHQGL